MIVTRLRIDYDDGTAEVVTADQRDGQAFYLWANRRGITAPAGRDLSETMQTVFLRVCAWSAHQRAQGVTVEWDTWSDRVAYVTLEAAEAVDPTGEASGA